MTDYRQITNKTWNINNWDSDSDYEEDTGAVEFLLLTKDHIAQRVHQNHVKLGIKRRPGYYKIGTKRYKPEQIHHYYNQKHWDVQAEESCVLERKLRKQTLSAVDNAVDSEKLRRMRENKNRYLHASNALLPVNNEMSRIIQYNVDEEKKLCDKIIQQCEDNLGYSLNVLTRMANDQNLKRAVEDERERRLAQMNDMTDDSKNASNAEFMEFLKCSAHVNSIWTSIQSELDNAMGDLEVVKAEEEHALDDLYREMKDDLVLSFKRATNLLNLQMQEENEKRRRLAEARAFASGKKEMDHTRSRSMQLKVRAHQELTRIFAGVVQNETQMEVRTTKETERHHEDVMSNMVRRQSIQWADHECVLERSRRILEAEREDNLGTDYEKERIKDAMQNIQERMVIERFGGHRVTPQRGAVAHQRDDQFETEHDRKLRQHRLKSRRQSCVVAGMNL